MQLSFTEVAESIGCLLGPIREDDRIHRCATELHPKKRNGSYRTDGQRGWVKNWETGETATWHEAQPQHGRRSPPKPLPSLAKRRAEEAAAAKAAARTAKHMVSAAALDLHPYLERKGFPKLRGLVHEGMLLVPARIGAELVSLQKIDAEGEKRFLTGGKVAGAAFTIGSGRLEILCEGYATGLSIKAALDGLHLPSRVTCCLSAANIATLAEKHQRALVVADNDTPRQQFGGIGAGEYYARKTGLPWTMPPDVETDANDLHLKAGLPALQRLLLELTLRRRIAA